MVPKEIQHALALLRNIDVFEKQGGVLKGLSNVAKAIDVGGAAAARHLKGKGHKQLALAARVAPHAVVGAGAYKGYESEPVQRLRYKLKRWQLERQMRKAQQGSYR